MKKRVKQLGSYKKLAATHRLKDVPNTLPSKSSVCSPFQRVPVMKLSSSQLDYPSELERSPEYPVRLMQHTSPAHLGQQINEIIANSSPETLLHQSAQALGTALWVDCCLIMITVPDSATQVGYWHSDQNFAIPPQQQLLASKAQLVSLIQSGCEALIIDNIEKVENPLIEWHLPLPIRAVMVIPIYFQGKMNGIISFLRSQPYQWSELEKEHALAVASPVAIAISQVIQTSLITSLQQQVHASSQYQSLLKQLTLSSRSSLELNQIFTEAIAGTAQVLQVERGLIVTLKYVEPLFKTRSRKKIPKAKATVICEWHDPNSNVLDADVNVSLLNQSFWVSESWLCQQAFINSPKPLVIDAEHKIEAIASAEDAPLFNLNRLPTVLILPLESGGTVLGFLVLQHSGSRLWQSEELALVELVSAQLSNTIIQSQTLKQVQGLVEERTAQLQGSLEVQARLYETTRQQIDQLRKLNQLKDEFVSTMNHELRTPLTSMSLAIRMLRQSVALSPERQAKYLDILEQQCNQEINLVKDLLKLQELESHQALLNLETIDLKPKIHNLADSFTEKWVDKGLNITLDLPKASLLVQTDIDSFERILQELLTNAGKYSNPDTTIVLQATHSGNQQDKQIIFTLTNFGTGISPEDITHVFDKFRRGQGVTQQAIQGTGLGLALVKCLVQHLNGTIVVSSKSNSQSSDWETCFTVTLPQFFDHTNS